MQNYYKTHDIIYQKEVMSHKMLRITEDVKQWLKTWEGNELLDEQNEPTGP